VTAHGGSLSVKSTPGKGTTYRMDLPVAPREVDAPSPVVDVL
jgi:signal transduction histidine kinase